MFFSKKLILMALLAACFAGSLAGCGSGGGGGGGVASVPLTAVAGTWAIDLTMGDNPCDPGENGDFQGTETIVFRQSGANVEIYRENGELLASGTIDLNNVIRLSLEGDPNSTLEMTVTPSLELLDFTLVGFSKEQADNCAEKIRMNLEGVRFSLSTDFRLPACVSEEIAVGVEVARGSTDEEDNDFEPSCADSNGSGPDTARLFTAPVTTDYTFTLITIEADFTAVLALYADDCVTELGCTDPTSSELTMTLSAGESVVVVVDGVFVDSSGEYELTVFPTNSCWNAVVELGTQKVTVANLGDPELARAFLFEAPAQGRYLIQLEADPQLAATVLREEHCDDGQFVEGLEHEITLEAGQRLILAYFTASEFETGEYDLTIRPLDCWTEVAELGVNEGSTLEQNDDFDLCGATGGPDTAHVFVAPASGYYTIGALDSSPVLATFTGDCEELIACHDPATHDAGDELIHFMEAGDQIVIVVKSNPAIDYTLVIDVDVHYRVNCGGTELEDTSQTGPSWSEDTQERRSDFVNVSADVNFTGAFDSLAIADATVPNSMPLELFSSSRYHADTSYDMEWSFPVPNGSYELRLGLAEMWSGADDPGTRVFSVDVEGEPMLEDFDQAAELGFGVATVKTVTVAVTDGSLDIDFLRVNENPTIKSIEIVAAPDATQER